MLNNVAQCSTKCHNVPQSSTMFHKNSHAKQTPYFPPPDIMTTPTPRLRPRPLSESRRHPRTERRRGVDLDHRPRRLRFGRGDGGPDRRRAPSGLPAQLQHYSPLCCCHGFVPPDSRYRDLRRSRNNDDETTDRPLSLLVRWGPPQGMRTLRIDRTDGRNVVEDTAARGAAQGGAGRTRKHTTINLGNN